MLPPTTAIARNKSRLMVLMCVAVVFVAGGVWLLSLDAQHWASQRSLRHPLMFTVFGFLTIFLMGFTALFTAAKLFFDTAPGLVLSREGLTDHSNLCALGFVPWSDVKGFEVKTFKQQKILCVVLHSPERLIAKASPWLRPMLRINQFLGFSAMALSSISLSTDFDALESLVRAYFHEAQMAARINA